MRWSLFYILASVGCDSVVDFGSAGAEAEDRRVADTGPAAAAPPTTTPTGDTAAPVNMPPTMLPPFAFTLNQGGSLSERLMAGDDDGDPIEFELVSVTAAGALSLDQQTGDFTYVPLAGFSGTDSFEVVADDGTDESTPAVISLVVVPAGGFSVQHGIFLTDEEVPVSGTVVSSSSGSVTFRVAMPPRAGVVSLATGTGDFTYTPAVDFSGVDDFTVVANDGASDSLPGRIVVQVAGINDAPVVVPNPFTAFADVSNAYIIDATDAEGDTLTFAIDAAPTNGSATVSAATGTLEYTPNLGYTGPDSVGVEVSDGSLSVSASIPITVLTGPPDSDGDTVPDSLDQCPGFDDRLDQDGDTVPDGCDRCPGSDDALDSDFDAVPDGCDVCPGFDDAVDTDGDGIPDGCEP